MRREHDGRFSGPVRILLLSAPFLITAAALGLPPPAVAPLAGQQTSMVERGEISGAAYRIEIPANWNRGLVMYAHGYAMAGKPYPLPDDELIAQRAGTSDRFVAKFVAADGHCNISARQMASAFDALLAWARQGKKPASGEQGDQ